MVDVITNWLPFVYQVKPDHTNQIEDRYPELCSSWRYVSMLSIVPTDPRCLGQLRLNDMW